MLSALISASGKGYFRPPVPAPASTRRDECAGRVRIRQATSRLPGNSVLERSSGDLCGAKIRSYENADRRRAFLLNSLRKRSGRRKQGDGHSAEMQSVACRGYWV